MASGRTLNAANLERLGTALLAELLIEISKGNAAAQRRLRLALAGNAGTDETARAVARRLTSIAGAKTWLNWQKIKPFATELEVQHRVVLEAIAPSYPREAFDLLWRLAGCAQSVFARSDDGSGRLAAVFAAVVRDLGPLAQRAGTAAEELAGRVFRALTTEPRGAWEELISLMAPQLGRAGLDMLRTSLRTWQAAPAGRSGARETRVIGWSSSGPIHAGDVQVHHRGQAAAVFLRQVADALGDVDGFIEQFDDRTRRSPDIAAAIARRLLAAGRLQDAWSALERVEAAKREQAPLDWEQARVDVLQALGRADEAQAFRWQRFLATLDATHLRAYLKTLPDFEDFEAEQHALDHALVFGNVHRALSFLVSWPDLHRANDLVLGRMPALDGNLYELLSPAADALDDKYPLAATLLRRAMIDFTLGAGRSSRYKYAARHLLDCRASSERVADFAGVPDHPTYERALRTSHGRKAAFWQETAASG